MLLVSSDVRIKKGKKKRKQKHRRKEESQSGNETKVYNRRKEK